MSNIALPDAAAVTATAMKADKNAKWTATYHQLLAQCEPEVLVAELNYTRSSTIEAYRN